MKSKEVMEMRFLKSCKKAALVIMTAVLLVCAVPASVMAHGYGGNHHSSSVCINTGHHNSHHSSKKGVYCSYHHKRHNKKSNCKRYCTVHKITHKNGKRHYLKHH